MTRKKNNYGGLVIIIALILIAHNFGIFSGESTLAVVSPSEGVLRQGDLSSIEMDALSSMLNSVSGETPFTYTPTKSPLIHNAYLAPGTYSCEWGYQGVKHWTYDYKIYIENNRIMREIYNMYAYNGLATNEGPFVTNDVVLKVSSGYTKATDSYSIGNCIMPPVTLRATDAQQLYQELKTSQKEGIVELDLCITGISDPNIYDGKDEIKCNNYCKAGQATCVWRTDDYGNYLGQRDSHYCDKDGQTLTSTECGGKLDCSSEEVPDSDNPPYTGMCIADTFCSPNQIIKYGLHQYTCNIDGNSIGKKLLKENFQVTAKTFVQYNTEPVTYIVRMKDAAGVQINPERITNLKAVATLSNGQIVSSAVDFQGGELYEVTSIITGQGDYYGHIEFDFLGDRIASPEIKIDVRDVSVNIDTSQIVPAGELGQLYTYKVSFFDSLGNKIDPDKISIRVTYPDGITTEEITSFTKTAIGDYEFVYSFAQVEKYSFDISAEKEGLVKGIAKATVAVSGETEQTAGVPIFKYLMYIVPIALVFFIMSTLILGRKKR